MLLGLLKGAAEPSSGEGIGIQDEGETSDPVPSQIHQRINIGCLQSTEDGDSWSINSLARLHSLCQRGVGAQRFVDKGVEEIALERAR